LSTFTKKPELKLIKKSVYLLAGPRTRFLPVTGSFHREILPVACKQKGNFFPDDLEKKFPSPGALSHPSDLMGNRHNVDR
jgi:hypothetical protein